MSWADQVGRFLEELGTDEAGAQWERWIGAYWSGRIQSTPLPLASAEASAMARWLIGLPTVRGEAVALLVQAPAGLPQHGGFLHRIHDLDLTPDAASWATAITHLLRGTTGPNWVLGHYPQAQAQAQAQGDCAATSRGGPSAGSFRVDRGGVEARCNRCGGVVARTCATALRPRRCESWRKRWPRHFAATGMCFQHSYGPRLESEG
ncbi:MAG: DUF4020 domain-containing protein [Kineosporiaceae bacterium]|nr:DUF4020 domain-containing protein [Aeromicrobium sp.]